MIIERLSLERIDRNSTVSRETIIGGGRFVLRKCLQAARYVQENALMVEAQLGQSPHTTEPDAEVGDLEDGRLVRHDFVAPARFER